MRDAGGVDTYWYTSPKHHVLEWLAFHAVAVPALVLLARRAWRVDVPAAPDAVSSSAVWAGKARDPAAGGGNGGTRRVHSSWWLNTLDVLLRIACWGHAAATIYYKTSTGRAVYLFQPCHLSNYILCWLCFNKSPFASKAFYLCVPPFLLLWFAAGTTVHWYVTPSLPTHSPKIHSYITFWYGTLLALVTPDLRGLHMVGEQFNFFSQHIMLVLLPAVWIVKRRYTMYKGMRLSLMMWVVAFLVHFDLLLPVSLTLVGNVNYMMVPPSVYPMGIYPAFYRVIISLFCILLTFFSRHIMGELIIVASGIRKQAEAERLEAVVAEAAAAAAAAKPSHAANHHPAPAADAAVPPPSPPSSRAGVRKRAGSHK